MLAGGVAGRVKPRPRVWGPSRRHNAHTYRSGLEDKNAKHLQALGEPVHYETFKVRYVVPAIVHSYTVDFRLRNGILVETKGIWDATDRAKHLYVRTQYPELDIRLVFTRAHSPIYKGSPTTYADWAEKHGMVWAEKLIPEAWTKEQGPARAPEDVIKAGPLGYRETLNMEVKRR